MSDRRRPRMSARGAWAVVLVTGVAVAAATSSTAGPGAMTGDFRRVQTVDISLLPTEDPSVVRREFFETIGEECAAQGETVGRSGAMSTAADGPRGGGSTLGLVQTFPAADARWEMAVPAQEQSGDISVSLMRRRDGYTSQELASFKPWQTVADGPGAIARWSITRRKQMVGGCPEGWKVGERRIVSQRKLKTMPPPLRPDGPPAADPPGGP